MLRRILGGNVYTCFLLPALHTDVVQVQTRITQRLFARHTSTIYSLQNGDKKYQDSGGRWYCIWLHNNHLDIIFAQWHTYVLTFRSFFHNVARIPKQYKATEMECLIFESCGRSWSLEYGMYQSKAWPKFIFDFYAHIWRITLRHFGVTI